MGLEKGLFGSCGREDELVMVLSVVLGGAGGARGAIGSAKGAREGARGPEEGLGDLEELGRSLFVRGLGLGQHWAALELASKHPSIQVFQGFQGFQGSQGLVGRSPGQLPGLVIY